MTTARGRVVGLMLACSLYPAVSSAQLSAPREAAQIEFGPVSLYPSLQIVDAGRDENVFNDYRDPKTDFTFTLASRALVVMRLGLNQVMFSSGSDYVWFKKYASERSSNATYALRLNLSASRFKPFLGATRTRTRTRPSVEIDLRAQRLERTLVAGSNFNLTERTAITLSGQLSEAFYDDIAQFRGARLDDALSRTGRLYSAGVRYAVTPLTTLQVTGNYGEDIFPETHLRDARRFSLTPALEFSPDAAIRGRISGGYEVFRPLRGGGELAEHRGFVVDGSLNWTTHSLTSFDLIMYRNVNYSYQDTLPYYIETRTKLTVSQRLFLGLEIFANGDQEFISYRWRHGGAPVSGEPVRDDTSLTASTGVAIPLLRGFKLVLGMEQARRKSQEDPLANYKRRRLISTITVGR